MSAPPATAFTPREYAQLPGRQAFVYGAVLRFIEATGRWRFPIHASGDYEEMKLRDILYWLHKAKHHVVHPERGSHLDAYFEAQQQFQWSVPDDFTVTRELSISAVGDLMDHEYLLNSPGLYRHVADHILGVDLPMANLECVVLDEPSETPRFDGKTAPRLRIDSRTMDVLTSYEGRRYAFLSAACNHSLDFGLEGVLATSTALRDSDIAFHGINETLDDAGRALLLEKNGILVAVFSHTFGLNAWKPPLDRPWIVNRTRLNDTQAQLDL